MISQHDRNAEDILKRKSVLYVEDDTFTRDEMAFFLEEIVESLHLAANGKEGLELFKQHRPDFVITDVQMPVMSGLEMLKQIRKIDEKVPVIVTTAFNETNYLLSAINNGANRYLLKPINLKELQETLGELCDVDEELYPYQSLDDNGRIVDVNQPWLDFLGYRREEVVGHYIGEFVADECHEMLEGKFPVLKDHGSLTDLHFRMKRKDGILVEVMLNATASYRLDGSFHRTHCELRTIDFYMKSEARTTTMLEQERYLNGLITTHAAIGKAISKSDTVDGFLDEVCTTFVENAAFELAFITLMEGERRLRVVSQSHHETIDMAALVGPTITMQPDSACIACQAMQAHAIVIVDDLSKIDRQGYHEVLKEEGVKAMVAFPIGIDSQKSDIGALVLMLRNHHAFGKEEFELFESISETVAFGMQAISDRKEKERLIEQLHIRATTDTLTGSINRSRGMEIMADEVERFRRYGHPLSLIFFDIDRFKQINDTYGHETGDRVLKAVTAAVGEGIRATDSLVRWGGEEFIALLPETTLEHGVELAQKLRGIIGKMRVDDAAAITASFGVTQLREGEGWEQLVSRADALMYAAKLEGRDNVQSD